MPSDAKKKRQQKKKEAAKSKDKPKSSKPTEAATNGDVEGAVCNGNGALSVEGMTYIQ